MKYLLIAFLFSTPLFAQGKYVYPTELIEQDDLNGLLNAISEPRVKCECETNSEDGIVTVPLTSKPLPEMRDECVDHERKFYMAKNSSGGINNLTELMSCRTVIGTQSYVNGSRSG